LRHRKNMCNDHCESDRCEERQVSHERERESATRAAKLKTALRALLRLGREPHLNHGVVSHERRRAVEGPGVQYRAPQLRLGRRLRSALPMQRRGYS
jgi:hypothetical protein